MPTALSAAAPAASVCRDCCEMFGAGSAAELDRCPWCGSARLVTHPEIDTLAIAHIDCDAFYASVEKRDRPEIREHPVIVGHPGGRGVVTTACYIARRFGVRSAMPMFQALERCPDAVVVPPDMAKYKAVSQQIRAIFERATATIEPVSLDEAYLDLSPEHLVCDEPAAQALALIASRVEDEVAITVSIGLAPNKFLAKLASELKKPRGYSIIGAREAKTFLAPLAVSKINGVGEVTALKLQERGIHTIGDLQAMSEMALVTLFGRFGRRLATYAQGQDERAVTPSRGSKSISAETTFRQDIADPAQLIEIAKPLCDRVAAQLARKNLAGATVVLKLKTADFQVWTRHRRLLHPTQLAAVLLREATALIEQTADGRRFRLIGVGVDSLGPAAEADPPDLFGSG